MCVNILIKLRNFFSCELTHRCFKLKRYFVQKIVTFFFNFTVGYYFIYIYFGHYSSKSSFEKKYHMTLIENKRPILIDFKQLFNRNKIIQTIFSVMYFNITKMELFSKIHLKPCDCCIKTSVGTRVGRRAQNSIIRPAGCERQIRRTLRNYCSRSLRQLFCKQIFVKSL